MELRGSVALVTGANRGLGKAFVEELLEAGAAKVYAAARDVAKVTPAERVEPLRLDVTRPEDVTAVARACRDVTLLVNNAGIARPAGLLDPASLASARAEWETLFLGPLALSQSFAPILAANGGGAIVNVLSALSWITLDGLGTYGAAKAAAWSLTNALRNEMRGRGTQVVGLHVGFVDTDMARGVEGPKADPREVARRALEALSRNEPEVLADALSVSLKQGLSAGAYLNPSRR